jgi:hypothetical protein
MPRKRKIKPKPHKRLYALYDAAGVFWGVHMTMEDALDDAVGPRFRPVSRVIVYERTPTTKRVQGR